MSRSRRRPVQKPTLHPINISRSEPSVAKVICTRTETRVDSKFPVQRDLLLLKLGTNSYVLDIYGFSIAVQICGAIWRYTFIIPHVQEKKGPSNHDKITYIEEATIEFSHVSGALSITETTRRHSLENIRITNCFAWLHVPRKNVAPSTNFVLFYWKL